MLNSHPTQSKHRTISAARLLSYGVIALAVVACGGGNDQPQQAATASELRLSGTASSLAIVGVEVDAEVSVEGGRPPYRFDLVQGRLPPGVSLDAATGRLVGSPSASGEFPVTLGVTDSAGKRLMAEWSVIVDATSPWEPPSQLGAPSQPATVLRNQKRALDNAPLSDGAVNLGPLLSTIAAMPEGSWARVNLNSFSNVWTPADLRPLYRTSNPTPAKIIQSWSSFTWDSNRAKLMLYGGGHANYRGNDVYAWNATTRLWERAALPSQMVQDAMGHWVAIDGVDKAPASAHTYDNTVFFPVLDRMVVLGGAADSNGGHFMAANGNGTSRKTGPYLFDPSRANGNQVGGSTGSHVMRVAPYPEVVGGSMWVNREAWLNAGPTSAPPNESFVNGCTGTAIEGGQDVLYVRTAHRVYRYRVNNLAQPAADTWQLVGRYVGGSGSQATCAYDPQRRALVAAGRNSNPFHYWDMNRAGSSNPEVYFTPVDVDGQFYPLLAASAIDVRYCAIDYDPRRDEHLLWCGDRRVWRLKPPQTLGTVGWEIRLAAPSGDQAPSEPIGTGVLGKWKYIPNLGVFMGLADPVNGNIWVYKPAGWTNPSDANLPPSVAIDSPASGASVDAGAVLAVSAQSSDTDGAVGLVEFYANGVKFGEAAAAPFRANWTASGAGTVSLTAVATDDDGARTTSAAVLVTVVPLAPPNMAPTVVLSAPVGGAGFAFGTPIALAATAGDNDGVVARVEFFVGTTSLGVDTTAPYTANWVGAPIGSHVLSAVATDDDGAQTVSAVVTIQVSDAPPPNAAPSVALTSPAPASSFESGAPIAMSASASDTDGAVVRVAFYAGAVKLGEDDSAPFEFVWTGAPGGSHVLTARAVDDDGAEGVSVPIAVTVVGGTGETTVTLQRGGSVPTVVADTYLSNFHRSSVYGTSTSALDQRLSYATLLRFAIFQSEGGPVPDGAQILSATMSVYKFSAYDMVYALHPMLVPWTEASATWNQRQPGVPWATAGAAGASTDYSASRDALGTTGWDPGWVEFDVTTRVSALSNGSGGANHGWRLLQASGYTTGLKRFHLSEFTGDPTLRPRLVIRYR